MTEIFKKKGMKYFALHVMTIEHMKLFESNN